MNSKRFLSVAWIVVLALVLKGYMSRVEAQDAVRILIVDDFVGRALGFIPKDTPNPDSGSEDIGSELYQAAQAYVNDVPPDPDTTVPDYVDDALGALSHFEIPIIQAIEDELSAAITDDTACLGYFPDFRTDGQGHYITQGAGPDDPGPHGNVVLYTMLKTANAAQLQSSLLPIPGRPDFDAILTETRLNQLDVEIEGRGNTILVNLQDTEFFSLEKTEEVIRTTVDTQSPWVINASFAIIPCQQVALFSEYEALIAAANAAKMVETSDTGKIAYEAILQETITRLINEVTHLPPAFRSNDDAFDCESSVLCNFLNSQNQVILVAAAGNTGLQYPFYPAGYPRAVSVSASGDNAAFFVSTSDPNPPCRLDMLDMCTNYGEVNMPGVISYYGRRAFGTSFAAPRLSLRLAGYLIVTGGQNTCNLLESHGFSNQPLRDLMSACDALAATGDPASTDYPTAPVFVD